MKLPHPFYRLPISLDVQRLQEEVAALPEAAWHAHPTGYKGNASVRLISADGGENDDMIGDMQPTQWLDQMPYVRQILSQLGLVWSRSRLMRLEPGARVPPHSDVSYHWRNRLRLHMPIITDPAVEFQCDDQTVHMEAGSVWTFDNWRPHQVNNRSDIIRIHLVADTCGNSRLLNSLSDCVPGNLAKCGPLSYPKILWQNNASPAPLRTEHGQPHSIMPASEVELIAGGFLRDLPDAPAVAVQQWQHILTGLIQDWQELWSQFRDGRDGWPAYRQQKDATFAALKQIQQSVPLKSNGLEAMQAVKSGLISYLLAGPADQANPSPGVTASSQNRTAPLQSLRLPRPVFIVAAPRSGSTLLYETLSVSPHLWTLGGEAHWLIEQFSDWQPQTGAVDSNRLQADALTPERAQAMLQSIAARLRDHRGTKPSGHATLRWLEKTPKNALRIPLLKALFPDALFVHLWRDPKENIASIINAWEKGRWVTYNELPGWPGPWSLLLPPGWQSLKGKTVADIAAFQWTTTNRVILEDLARIPAHEQIRVSYSDLCSNPEKTLYKILQFAGVPLSPEIESRCSQNLPLSRYTDTPPSPEKWKHHEQDILRILPQTNEILLKINN